jgi:hypothetical protein
VRIQSSSFVQRQLLPRLLLYSPPMPRFPSASEVRHQRVHSATTATLHTAARPRAITGRVISITAFSWVLAHGHIGVTTTAGAVTGLTAVVADATAVHLRPAIGARWVDTAHRREGATVHPRVITADNLMVHRRGNRMVPRKVVMAPRRAVTAALPKAVAMMDLATKSRASICLCSTQRTVRQVKGGASKAPPFVLVAHLTGDDYPSPVPGESIRAQRSGFHF